MNTSSMSDGYRGYETQSMPMVLTQGQANRPLRSQIFLATVI